MPDAEQKQTVTLDEETGDRVAKPRYHVLAVEGIPDGQRLWRRVAGMPHVDLPPTRTDDPRQARTGVKVAPRLDAHGWAIWLSDAISTAGLGAKGIALLGWRRDVDVAPGRRIPVRCRRHRHNVADGGTLWGWDMLER